ncbi:MAG TPA: hypothetical protein DCM86_10895, partial [Verrucomicrobiales bacterium]|nr:hypothetical protein [Verrucomicrobiales bacterium]
MLVRVVTLCRRFSSIRLFASLVVVLMFCGSVSAGLPPVLTGFQPRTGPAGTIVTINGEGFAQTRDRNRVRIGGLPATVQEASSTELRVIVPVGATLEPPVVTVEGLSAVARGGFGVLNPSNHDLDGALFGDGVPLELPEGAGPQALAAPDLDNDGRADLVCANFYLGTLSIFPNATASPGAKGLRFGERIDLPVGAYPTELVSSDLDGDGFQDLVVLNRGDHTVGVVRNGGVAGAAGGFILGVVTNLPTGQVPHSIAVADLDRDGRPDLAVALLGRVLFFRNTGSPGNLSFEAAGSVEALLEEPAVVTLPDLDGDGLPDVVVTRFLHDRLGVWINQSLPGEIRFDLVVNIDYGAASDLSPVDLNGDGAPDLAFALPGEGGVATVRNSSSPGHISAGTLDNDIVTGVPSAQSPRLLAAEVTGDGRPDLLLVDEVGGRMRILVNGLDAVRFQEGMFSPQLELRMGFAPTRAYAADFDGDGLADLALCGGPSGRLELRLNQLRRDYLARMTSPSDGLSLPWGETIPLRAEVYWGVTSVDHLDFMDGELLVGSVSQPPYQLAYLPLRPGAHRIRAVAHGVDGSAMASDVVSVQVALANDSFAGAAPLGPVVGGEVSGSNFEATSEPGEPQHAGKPGGRSVWWRWVAPSSGLFTLTTDGSSFDTLLAVYKGETLEGLEPVAAGDDHDGLPTSQAAFVAVGGQEYRVAVDGYAGGVGAIHLAWSFKPLPPVPENDRFDARGILSGGSVTVQSSNFGAGSEPTDPELIPSQSRHTLWWTWHAPASGHFAIQMTGTTFDHLVALYQGEVASELQILDYETGFLCCGAARLVFEATEGEAYSIEVDGINGGQGDVRFQIFPVVVPSNDDFASRTLLSGLVVQAAGSNEDASREPREVHVAREQGNHSIWWEWTAPLAGTYVLSTEGTDFPHLMAVLQGSALTNLSLLASNVGPGCCLPGRLLFDARSGGRYVILIDGLGAGMGPVQFQLHPVERPVNDRFEDAVTVSGGDVVFEGSNLDASVQPLEPVHGPGGGGHTLWWTWVAEADGTVAITTAGSAIPCDVAVYRGDRLDALSRVGQFRDIDSRPATVDVAQGVTYRIAVDGEGYAQGGVRVTWSSVARPANDLFARRRVLSVGEADDVANNAFASKEPGEPNHAGFDGGRSLWWSWEAGAGDAVVISTEGTGFDHTLAVYSGTALSSLVELGDAIGLECCGAARVVLDNKPGTVYQIAVDSLGDSSGEIHLSVESVSRPENDSFIGRPTIGGSTASWVGDNLNATKRFDEPDHAGNPGGKSIWWRWKAPASGRLDLAVTDADFRSLLAVYLGDSLATLIPVASSVAAYGSPTNILSMNVVAGTEYQLVVDGFGGQEGHLRLSLAFDPDQFLLASQFRTGAWVPDGPVYSMVEREGVLYLGGRFNFIRPSRGSGVALDVDYQAPEVGFPEVDGEVLATVSDGSGGWYLGGRFRRVGGEPCGNLAHILPDHSVDPLWAPQADGPVRALAVSQATLFVGGEFHYLDRQHHEHLAAVELGTGQILAWDAGVDGPVTTLLANGGDVYVAGGFTHLLGGERSRLAAFRWEGSMLSAWAPQPDGDVYAMAVTCDMLYVGGAFTRMAGGDRQGLASFALLDLKLTGWDPSPDCAVYSLAPAQDRIYVGGCFEQIDAVPRRHIARLDAITGAADDWDPDPDRPVTAVAVGAGPVYIGGAFSTVGGVLTGTLAVVDPVSGASVGQPIQASGLANAMAISGRHLFVGGPTLGLGGVPRRNLAAMDLSTGRPTDWNPGTDGEVFRLLLQDSILYVGGDFTQVAGEPRAYLAALDLAFQELTPWDPSPDGAVYALAQAGPWVVAGGDFQNLQGAPRPYLAAWSLVDGTLIRTWEPTPDGVVLDLEATDDTVFAAGEFGTMSGEPHRGIAKIDRVGGRALPWDPHLDGDVRDCQLDGGTVWVAGGFTHAGGDSQRS